ncbi:putative U-box domain-containing protein 53 [Nymphaea colorata]|nr:putative U-box domain-containing protein 53 [Nymphaea colorata]
MEVLRCEKDGIVASSTSASSVAVAVNGSRNSLSALFWALKKFVPEGKTSFKLIYVRPRITTIPTPMGNSIPVSNVREEVVAAYRKEIEWETNTKLLPFKQMCAQKPVAVETNVIEADDIAEAISEEIAKSEIHILALGSSSRSIFSRKLRNQDVSKRVSGCVPNFCTVYVISKGKVSSIHPASLEDKNSTDVKDDGLSSKTESSGEISSIEDVQSHYPSLLDQRDHAISAVNCIGRRLHPGDIEPSQGSPPVHSEEFAFIDPGCASINSLTAISTSEESFESETDFWIFDRAFKSDIRAVASTEPVIEINNVKMHEANEIKEMSSKEEIAIRHAKDKKEKHEATDLEAKFAKNEHVWGEGAKNMAANEVKEKHVLEKPLEKLDQKYKKFPWEEIVSASSSFSESLRIGSGAYGTVYRCKFHHVMAAVKVLQINDGCKTKHFQQELEVLSEIRHPHLLMLLGACPDHGCLVYEFMQNGSLHDRLLRKNNTPPLPWFDRFRIAWEVASALFFLHNLKPKPIIHCDLKPANILLDHNLVSKISDVGLTTLLPKDHATSVFKNTALAATFCYIDPEYQRTGLMSPKSDTYALGLVILQLLTAKPPMALAHLVGTAVLENKLQNVLDYSAGEWPTQEAEELANLGLSCVELRRCDRPDLKDDVLPMLERLKEVSELAHASISKSKMSPSSHFRFPILKDVKQDPSVAADGYTYERRGIERWLGMNDRSPMTELPLPSRALVPNYTHSAAIADWRSKGL